MSEVADPSGVDPVDPVALDAVELVRVRLGLRRALRSAHGVERGHREVVLVRALGADGVEGWGECSALERPTYTGEFTDGAWAVLRDLLVPAALAGRGSEVVGHPFASAALADARLDVVLRRRGRSLATAFGGDGPDDRPGDRPADEAPGGPRRPGLDRGAGHPRWSDRARRGGRRGDRRGGRGA